MTRSSSCSCGECAACEHRIYIARNWPAMQIVQREAQRKMQRDTRSQLISLDDAEHIPMRDWVELTEDQIWSVVEQYLEEIRG